MTTVTTETPLSSQQPKPLTYYDRDGKRQEHKYIKLHPVCAVFANANREFNDTLAESIVDRDGRLNLKSPIEIDKNGLIIEGVRRAQILVRQGKSTALLRAMNACLEANRCKPIVKLNKEKDPNKPSYNKSWVKLVEVNDVYEYKAGQQASRRNLSKSQLAVLLMPLYQRQFRDPKENGEAFAKKYDLSPKLLQQAKQIRDAFPDKWPSISCEITHGTKSFDHYLKLAKSSAGNRKGGKSGVAETQNATSRNLPATKGNNGEPGMMEDGDNATEPTNGGEGSEPYSDPDSGCESLEIDEGFSGSRETIDDTTSSFPRFSDSQEELERLIRHLESESVETRIKLRDRLIASINNDETLRTSENVSYTEAIEVETSDDSSAPSIASKVPAPGKRKGQPVSGSGKAIRVEPNRTKPASCSSTTPNCNDAVPHQSETRGLKSNTQERKPVVPRRPPSGAGPKPSPQSKQLVKGNSPVVSPSNTARKPERKQTAIPKVAKHG